MRRRKMGRGVATLLVTVLVMWASGATVLAEPGPDATDFGPFATTNAEYKLPAALDAEVVPDLPVELWARVHRPADLTGGPFPLVVFLHGNHATCGFGSNPRIDDRTDYTFSGTCPSGYVVTPSHAGYDYLAERLASHGYIVVSINANRGINAAPACCAPDFADRGRNQARGRLILRHLQKLSEWNRNGGTDPALGVELQGKLDFNHVGLMGHSRGGEGVRAAYNFYRDPGSPWPGRIGPVTFEGIFEIGPVDGQTNRQFIADGVPWDVLLPMCDGDVSNLQGVRVFDRMLRARVDAPASPKSTYLVWGANHNFYNTEWQISDSPGCFGHTPLWTLDQVGSADQQQTGLASVLALIRGNVGAGANRAFNQNFDPQFELPRVVTRVTRVDRGFTDSPNPAVTRVFDDFDRPTGFNSSGVPNEASKITISHIDTIPDHFGFDVYNRRNFQNVASISWSAPGEDVFFQSNWTVAGTGVDITAFKTLDLRISRQPSELNPPGSTNFFIRLAMDDGTLSNPVPLAAYTDVTGPVGGPFSLHQILQSARIPLTDFTGADLTRVHGVRLTFSDTASDAINLANLRLSTLSGAPVGSPTLASVSLRSASPSSALPAVETISEGNTIMISGDFAAASAGAAPLDIVVSSPRAFSVRDELPVLRIGAREFTISRYPPTGDTHTLIFTLTSEELAQVATGDLVTLQYGFGPTNVRWSFGPFIKPPTGS